MNLDPQAREINGLKWDVVQERVREYAKGHGLEVSPVYEIRLEDGAEHLRLYNKEALNPVAEFWPYFKIDISSPGGRSLENVKVEYHRDPSIKELLEDFGVTF